MSEAVLEQAPQAHHVLPPWLDAQRAALQAAPGHALLLHGPSGLGHYELALALVQGWLCESEDRTQGQASRQGACGRCASCLNIAAKAHTDLQILMPETLMLALGWPLPQKAQQDIDDKKRKASHDIRIEQVRDALEFSQLTSGRGQGKVILVYPAERLNEPSANALLKTLEEPQPGLRFVLASEAAHQLLPTIRSRCQAVNVARPTRAEAHAWMQTQAPQTSPEQLQIALDAAAGRPIEALNWLEAGLLSTWLKLPLALQKGHVQHVTGWSGAQLLDALFKLCHDLWAVKLGVQPLFFHAADLPKPPPARALAAWAEQLKDWARQIEHPFKQELLIEDMVNQAKLCINSKA